jgi:hypothetical protein
MCRKSVLRLAHFFFFAQTTLLLTWNRCSRTAPPILEELCKEHQILVWIRKQNKIGHVERPFYHAKEQKKGERNDYSVTWLVTPIVCTRKKAGNGFSYVYSMPTHSKRHSQTSPVDDKLALSMYSSGKVC